MPTTSSGLATFTIETRVTDPPLELYVTEQSFKPNPTTVRFARCMAFKPGDLVFDIGTGVGPLAIMAAKTGASRVIAVDPVPLHCELARMNVAKYGLQDKVTVLQGEFFAPIGSDPMLKNLKADVIIGDVSGIADSVARALGWYSDQVPTGGEDGTEVIIQFLKSAKPYFAPGGSAYFPIAVDLSDCDKINRVAHEMFESVENVSGRDSFIFPLSDDEIKAIHDAYHGKLPNYIKVQTDRRPHWRGQIWRATRPR